MLSALFARRYLFSKKSHSVINIISGVSVFAVAMPVAAMIILLSVFNGFEALVKSMASAFDSDLTVTLRQGNTFPISKLDTLSLQRIQGVESISFVLEESALLEYNGRQTTVKVRGVDDAYTAVMPMIDTAVTSGEYRVRQGDIDQVVLGQGMAYALGIRVLTTRDLSIYALRRNSFSTLLPLEGFSRRDLPISGLFMLDAESEKEYALTSLRLAQALFEYPDQATALMIHLTDVQQEAQVREELTRLLGDDFCVRNPYQMKPTFYDIMTYEKWGIFFISLLVLIIASFSIVGALVMLIIEKRPDMETLRALGADTSLLRHIFLGEGFLIGTMGAMIGVVIGVCCTLIQQYFGVIKIPVDTFISQSYPIQFQWFDLMVVVAVFAVEVAFISQLTVRSMIKQKERKR
ncbi:MAG: FtsX-like permease family protein [Alistipes sp.]